MNDLDKSGIIMGGGFMVVVSLAIYFIATAEPIYTPTPCEAKADIVARYQPCVDLGGVCLLDAYEARKYTKAVKFVEENCNENS